MMTTSPSGIGEPDRQRERVAAGLEQRTEDHHPAHEQQCAGDQQPVEHGPDPARQATRHAREGEQRGRGERHEHQVADVGDRRERHLASEHRLVPGPHRLTDSPTTGTRGRAASTLARAAGLAAAAPQRLATAVSATTISPRFDTVWL